MAKENIRMTGPEADSSARLIDTHMDELRKRGVNCKGYGILFKFPMLDTALTVEAKGIYCYICSYAGSDSTAFPGREKIMADLRMCKDSYYKHYQLLLDNDYLRVEQKNLGGNSHGFTKNIYEIVDCPHKFVHAPKNPHHSELYARICSGGLHDGGFGYIPRAVMVDRRLSVKAKALYGYYRSFSGAGHAACPEKKDLLYHLGISDKLYQRLMAELTGLGYITVVQRHVNGRLSVNDIHINTIPDEKSAGQRGLKVLRTGETSFTVQKQDTQNKDRQKEEPQKQDAQIKDANKSKINKNNPHQEQLHHQQCAAPAQEGWADDLAEELSLEELLWERETIPEEWAGNRLLMEKAVWLITDYDRRMAEGGEEAQAGSDFLLFTEALTDLLSAEGPLTLAGDRVRAADVVRRMGRYLHRSFARGALTLYDLEELSMENYTAAVRSQEVRNPLGYCKACIWNALKTGDAAQRAFVARSLGR